MDHTREPKVKLPSPSPTLVDTSAVDTTTVGNLPKPFFSKIRTIRGLLWLLIPNSLFTILYCLFVFYVLISKNVETPGPVIWDASKTNYVVGILSQFSAILTDATLKTFLAAARPTLTTATAATSKGLSWASWTAQGASGWVVILQVAAANGFLNGWCLGRLAMPFLSLGWGSVIKCECFCLFFFFFFPFPLLCFISLFSAFSASLVFRLSFLVFLFSFFYCLPFFSVFFPFS